VCYAAPARRIRIPVAATFARFGLAQRRTCLVLSLLGLGAVLCLRYPELLTVPEARNLYNVGLVRLALHLGLITAFVLGIASIVLRDQKALGFTALAIVLVATVLGGSRAQIE